jgi:threonine dehydratase
VPSASAHPETLERAAFEAVHRVIRPYVRETPTIRVDAQEFGLASYRLTMKLEQVQHAGSFKTRGAFANLLTREIPDAGVVAASGGNHGAAVAYAAMRLGIRAKIFVPTVASRPKIAAIRACGADLAVIGERYADALAASQRWAEQSGALSVHAFDQRETLLGQGTIGMELSAQAPDLDVVIVPVGGGGLIGGIAAWYGGTVRVVGVEPESAPTLTLALQAGRPVDAPAGGIAADALAPRRVGELMFPIAQARVHPLVLVSDAAMAFAQQQLWDRLRLVAEPAGAAALAALLSGAYRPSAGARVGIVISGGNTSAVSFATPSIDPREQSPAATAERR